MTSLKAALEASVYRDTKDTPVHTTLPDSPQSSRELLSLLEQWSKHEKKLWNGTLQYESGAVYHGDADLIDLQNQVLALFARSNPLHPSTFPFVRKMLSEIISMTISYFNGDPYQQKGIVTSGGTESICIAVRAFKNFAKSKWNSDQPFKPELILPITAHAAFHKACEMYEIKTVVINVNNKTYKPDPRDIENAINVNSIGIVGSAPDYAHGILDDIEVLSEIAYKHNIPCHVDCCLGSFLVSTLAKMPAYKHKIKPFDFRHRGVSSISCDTHKFGFAVKGTSVVMFRSNELRSHAYFCVSNTTIGLYATPTLLGSKNGAVVAACWATLMYFGKDGYKKEAMKIMQAAEYIKNEMRNNEEINQYIEIMGDPVMGVLCWKLTDEAKEKYQGLHVYQISEAIKSRGWSVNNLTYPASTHLCLTSANCGAHKKFVEDLIYAIGDVIKNINTNKYKAGTAMYGAMLQAGSVEDVNTFTKMWLDVIGDIPSRSKL